MEVMGMGNRCVCCDAQPGLMMGDGWVVMKEREAGARRQGKCFVEEAQAKPSSSTSGCYLVIWFHFNRAVNQ
jgi:hypothetical protein